ncbi:MAG: flippase-like domain-containing protein [Chitinophagaceae bacterium]|nr:flippase-like domain-containing protein [Chitinophagaceae bacterium]MCW5928817.1 flippase-like domain-containing protein [Chitinophagaceae bacterium]
MDKKKGWNIIKLLLKLLFTSLGLYIVYNNIDLEVISGILRSISPVYLAAALLLFVLSQIVASYRLLGFLKNIKLPVSVKYNMHLYAQGLFYNLFLPGGIGGDGYKIIVLNRKFKEKPKIIFGSLFFDRLSGLWALGLLSVIMSLFVNIFREYTWYIAAAYLAGSIIYYFVIARFFPTHIQRFFSTHGLALLTQSIQVGCASFILLALGYSGNFLPYLVIFLLSALSTLFPFTIGGLGAREMAIMYGATTLGLDKDLSVSVSICYYVLSAIVSLSGAVSLFLGKKE